MWRNRLKFRAWPLLAMLVIVVAACRSNPEAASGEGDRSGAEPTPTAAEPTKGVPEPTRNTLEAGDGANGHSPAPNPDADASGEARTDKDAGAANEVEPAADKPGGSVISPSESDAVRSKLAGVSIGDSREKVTARHGKPVSRYVLSEEDGPFTVYEYGGFSVGFDTSDRVRFVDVWSPDTDPGLKGLKIGQSVDEAVKALGHPDTKTDYVMTYVTETTVLKLDIDANTGTIRSIKLFPNSGGAK